MNESDSTHFKVMYFLQNSFKWLLNVNGVSDLHVCNFFVDEETELWTEGGPKVY